MSGRQVRTPARPAYGRATPLARNRSRRSSRGIGHYFGLVPRRVLILLLVAIVILVGLKDVFTIKSVKVNSAARQTEIEAEAKRLVDTNLSQGNMLTLNSSSLATALAAADPMIKTADVRRHWPNSLVVVITLKQPSLGWSSGNQPYLLDRDGTAIGNLPAGSNLPVVTDGSNLPVQLGQRVVSSRFVAFAAGVGPAMTGVGVKVTGLSVHDTTLDLYADTTKGYQIIFDTSRPVADEAGDLKLVLANLAQTHKTPTQYIDLRVPGKAYYK